MHRTITELKRSGNIAAVNDLIPYSGFLGLEAFTDERGLVTVLRYRDSNIGDPRLPALHGGVVGALLEHAAILHLLAETESDTLPKIITVSIDFLRPCRDQDTFARGTIVRLGRRIANVRVEAWQKDPATPVAAAHATFLTTE